MTGESLQILVFEVGGRHYGLPVSDVRELLRAVTILPLPHSSSAIEGIINLRGILVPVLDIRSRFQLPSRPLDCTDHFIVAQAGERLVALRVDRALDLIRLDAKDVEEACSVVPGMEEGTWVARLPAGGNLVLVLDLRSLVSRVEPAVAEKGGGT